jgi:hypothetical protein
MNHQRSDTGTAPCFPAGTLVQTPRGPVPIEALSAGEIVFSWDLDAGQRVPREVLAVHRNWAEHLVRLTTAKETFFATGRHPFWELTTSRWVVAGRLTPGMRLHNSAGEAEEILSTRVVATHEDTFNLEVDEDHNFEVTAAGYLAHNGDESGFLNLDRNTSYKIYVVREVVDGVPGKVIYVGQTVQTTKDRLSGHINKESSALHIPANDPRRRMPGFPESVLSIETVQEAGKKGWTKYDAHVWEQHYIDKHGGLAKDGGTLLNREVGIDPAKYEKYKHLHNPCM